MICARLGLRSGKSGESAHPRTVLSCNNSERGVTVRDMVAAEFVCIVHVLCAVCVLDVCGCATNSATKGSRGRSEESRESDTATQWYSGDDQPCGYVLPARAEATRRQRVHGHSSERPGMEAVWNIYRYATGILIVLILFRGGMVWWYLQVVLQSHAGNKLPTFLAAG